MNEKYYENGIWSLDSLYSGFDDKRFRNDMARLGEVNKELSRAAAALGEGAPAGSVGRIIPLLEEKTVLEADLFAYCEFRQSANTADSEAASMMGRVNLLASGSAKDKAEFDRYIYGLKDEAMRGLPEYGRYPDFFERAKSRGRYLLSGDGEDAAARYDVSGGGAWSELQAYMTSSVEEEFNGKKMGLSELRNLAYDPDPAVRRDAYAAELACYEGIKAPVAFSLNSIKLQSASECEMRGFGSVLDKSLYSARMSRATLDALWGAIEEYLPVFHRYYKAKARALGYKGGLPWYEMFAPMGKEGRRFTAKEARAYLVNAFSGFDPELAAIADRAFEEQWIDLYPRAGKVGGAYCENVMGPGEFRILTNFGGLFGDVVTLAHELGHGYHDMIVKGNPPLARHYSMPVAETASTFNENLVVSAAIKAASREEKLALVENRLQDAAQMVCDIYSRFLFEKSVCDGRPESFMFPDQLCGLMKKAQLKAYGDGLDPDTLHPYMWVCKSHYYSSGLAFYNYPYAFGGLLARGLYERYEQEGKAFLPRYKKMLRSTPNMCVEDAAGICGIDLTGREFWRESLEACRKDIELFENLVK